MTTRRKTKEPQELAARIGQFIKAVPEWLAAGSLRARAEAALEDEYQRDGPAGLTLLSTGRLAERDNWLTAKKGEALAGELETRGQDPQPLRELLAHVERDEYDTVDETWPRVKAWLQGAPARLRAGRPVGGRGEGKDDGEAPPVPTAGFLGARDLAERFKVPENKRNTLNKRLQHFREQHGDDDRYVLPVEPGSRQAHYLHAVEHVLPLIKDLIRP